MQPLKVQRQLVNNQGPCKGKLTILETNHEGLHGGVISTLRPPTGRSQSMSSVLKPRDEFQPFDILVAFALNLRQDDEGMTDE